jgi:hypothetical protein
VQSSFLSVTDFAALFVFVMDVDQAGMRFARIQSSPDEFSLHLTLQDGRSFPVLEILALLLRMLLQISTPDQTIFGFVFRI